MFFVVTRTSNLEGKPCREAIKKDVGWCVDINSLQELFVFVKKHGTLIIAQSSNSALEGLFHSNLVSNDFDFEIYDGYRE